MLWKVRALMRIDRYILLPASRTRQKNFQTTQCLWRCVRYLLSFALCTVNNNDFLMSWCSEDFSIIMCQLKQYMHLHLYSKVSWVPDLSLLYLYRFLFIFIGKDAIKWLLCTILNSWNSGIFRLLSDDIFFF